MIVYRLTCYVGIRLSRTIDFWTLEDLENWVNNQRAKQDNKYTRFHVKYIFK